MSKYPKSAAWYLPWSTYIDAREEARRRGERKVGTVQRTTDIDRRADQTSVEADAHSRLARPFARDTRSQESAGGIEQRETP
ncbi:MAG: hypothetical protein ACLPZR_00445 [Solirubrobacteraceae bacterium]